MASISRKICCACGVTASSAAGAAPAKAKAASSTELAATVRDKNLIEVPLANTWTSSVGIAAPSYFDDQVIFLHRHREIFRDVGAFDQFLAGRNSHLEL